MSVAFLGLGLLSILLGIPALFLMSGALKRARRLSASGRAMSQTRVLRVLAGLLLLLGVVGTVEAQVNINRERSHVLDRASPSMFDRSGLAAIQHRGHVYRNPNDVCSLGTGSPSVTYPCTTANRPPVRTKAWLIAHHDWPLVAIGEVRFPDTGTPGARWGVTGPTHQILRPAKQESPTLLLVSQGTLFLEYRRT